MAPESYDVIVIGSGIGGLVAATTAAREGRSVLVLEAAKQLGGFINPFQRKRFHFDPGIHYVGEAGPGGSLRRLLDGLDLHEVEFIEMDPTGFDWYVFPEYEVRNCRGLDAFHDRLLADFPAESKGLERFFQLIGRVERMTKRAKRLRGWMDLRHLLPYAPTLARWGRATLGQMLDHHFSEPNLKAALAGPCGNLGLPPSRVSGLLHLGVLAHYSHGAFFPKGGSGALRDAFVDALASHGARLETNTRVARILCREGVARGVETTDGQWFEAGVVVSNVQATDTFGMLEGLDLAPKLRRKIERTEHSLGSVCIFLGVDGDLDTSRVGSANVWHYDDNDIEKMYTPLLEDELPTRSSCFFLTVPSHKDPESAIAPPGKKVVELVTLASGMPFTPWFDGKSMGRGEDYEELKEGIADHYLEKAERYLPGLRGKIEVKEVSTPATNFSYVSAPGGNIYGPAHTPAQMGPWRFSPRGPARGLFLCGASIISAGILPAASSGRMAGKMALRYLSQST